LADAGCSEVAVSEGDDGAGAVVVTGGGQARVDHLTQLPHVVGPTPANTGHGGVSFITCNTGHSDVSLYNYIIMKFILLINPKMSAVVLFSHCQCTVL